MAFVIYCGEQDIEDNGVCISMSIEEDNGDTPEVILINIIDNLLGVSEFLQETGYDFADVGIDCRLKHLKLNEEFNLNSYLDSHEEVKDIFDKYVQCSFEEPMIENDTAWYSFCLDNISAKISEEDLTKFSSIFKEVTHEPINEATNDAS